MAIDTAEKRRNVGGNMPTPDGVISIYDRRHIAGNYRGMPMPIALSGIFTPTGTLAHTLTAYRSLGGGLTSAGALSRALTAYRGFGGSLTPTGSLLEVLTIVMALGGELDLEGALSGRNPAWRLIDETLRWMGEWNETYSYDANDTVLYKATDDLEWHVFTSKAGHNTGNNPDSSAAWWRRLYQEKFQ